MSFPDMCSWTLSVCHRQRQVSDLLIKKFNREKIDGQNYQSLPGPSRRSGRMTTGRRSGLGPGTAGVLDGREILALFLEKLPIFNLIHLTQKYFEDKNLHHRMSIVQIIWKVFLHMFWVTGSSSSSFRQVVTRLGTHDWHLERRRRLVTTMLSRKQAQ